MAKVIEFNDDSATIPQRGRRSRSPMRSRPRWVRRAATWRWTRSTAPRPSPMTASPWPRRSSSRIPSPNMGAQLLKEAATKTNDVAGDGTTTATVLAQAIVHEGHAQCRRRRQRHAAQAGPRAGVRCGGRRRSRSRPPPVAGKEEIAQVAAISAADTEIGESHRRGDGEGRQGRGDHRRGVQGPRVRDRVHRGHAVRPRLPLPLLRHQSGADGSGTRRAVHPDHRQEDLARSRTSCPLLEQVARAGKRTGDHRRGC